MVLGVGSLFSSSFICTAASKKGEELEGEARKAFVRVLVVLVMPFISITCINLEF